MQPTEGSIKLNTHNPPFVKDCDRSLYGNQTSNGWRTNAQTLVASFGILFCSATAHSAMLDESLVNDGNSIDAPGGVINRSLADQVWPGHGRLGFIR